MAQSISFNNVDILQAGAYTRINADRLLAPSILSGSRIAIIGPAKGGKANELGRFKMAGDTIAAYRRDNPLRYGMRYAFAHGASFAYGVRVGNPLQATIVGLGMTITAKDWGTAWNGTTVVISAGTTVSTFKVTVSWTDPDTQQTMLQIFDNLANVTAAIAALNSPKSTLVSATTGTGTLANGTLTLAGGDDDLTPSFSEWQAAVEVLRAKHVNILVPMTDDEAVHTLCNEFMSEQSSTLNRKEGRVVAGGALAETLTERTTRSGTQSSKRFQLVANGFQGFDDKGQARTFAPTYAAAALAGLQAALGVSEPATTKFATGMTALENDYTSVEKDRLIAAGCVFLEPNPDEDAGGFRFHRDVTTHTVDNVWEERTTVSGVDYVAINLRRLAEKVMIGKGITSARMQLLSELSKEMLTGFVQDNKIAAYGAVVVEQIAPGVIKRSYEISPIFGCNFVLDDISVVPNF